MSTMDVAYWLANVLLKVAEDELRKEAGCKYEVMVI